MSKITSIQDARHLMKRAGLPLNTPVEEILADVGAMEWRKRKVLPDATHRGMWRVRWPDGRLSDMTNITRAKDAVACFVETEERRQRGRHSPSEGRLCVSENGGARKQ